jgi:hypothetical protein
MLYLSHPPSLNSYEARFFGSMAGRLEGKICLITGAAGRESDDTQQIHFED